MGGRPIYSQVAELVDARGSNGSNSQLGVMLEGRYYTYRFESCPDYKWAENNSLQMDMFYSTAEMHRFNLIFSFFHLPIPLIP